jgi:hypothetical protein
MRVQYKLPTLPVRFVNPAKDYIARNTCDSPYDDNLTSIATNLILTFFSTPTDFSLLGQLSSLLSEYSSVIDPAIFLDTGFDAYLFDRFKSPTLETWPVIPDLISSLTLYPPVSTSFVERGILNVCESYLKSEPNVSRVYIVLTIISRVLPTYAKFSDMLLLPWDVIGSTSCPAGVLLVLLYAIQLRQFEFIPKALEILTDILPLLDFDSHIASEVFWVFYFVVRVSPSDDVRILDESSSSDPMFIFAMRHFDDSEQVIEPVLAFMNQIVRRSQPSVRALLPLDPVSPAWLVRYFLSGEAEDRNRRTAVSLLYDMIECDMIGVGDLPENVTEGVVALMGDTTFAVREECLFLLNIIIRKSPFLAARAFEAGVVVHARELAQEFPNAVLFLAHAAAVVLAPVGGLSRVEAEIRDTGILEACAEAPDQDLEEIRDIEMRIRAIRAIFEGIGAT